MGRLLRRRTTQPAARAADLRVRPHWLERAGGAADATDAARRWTVLGNVDAARRAAVDPRGLVSLEGSGWSLDWWIGAEDRWHLPSTDAAVRQNLLGATPVVETRVRVPGGDAVQRAYAARAASGAEAVVVEVHNASKVPFAVALAVRPYDLQRLGGPRDVAIEGLVVHVEGAPAVVLDRPPRHAVAGSVDDDDPAEVLFAGAATDVPPVGVTAAGGMASLVVLHPLAHTATLRVALLLDDPVRPDELADVRSVVAGWQAHARRGARAELPDRRLQAAVDASLRHLLLRPDGFPAASALDRWGHPLPAGDGAPDPLEAAAWSGRRSRRGSDRDQCGAGAAAVLVALVERWATGRDPAVARRTAPLLAELVARLRRAADDVDAVRARHRLGLAAALLDSAGEPLAAEDVRRTAVAAALALPPGDAPGPLAVAAAAVAGRGGAPSALATLRRARAELTWGRPASVLARLSWALGAGSGTWTWPADAAAGGPGSELDGGHDPAVNAALLLLVRGLLVDDLGDGLLLSPVVPDAWLGQGWEVHRLPTVHGHVSFAVRWHGERPALLWELEPAPGTPAVRLAAPALDASWSSTEPRGEALLGPVARPERAPRRGLTIPVSIEPSSGGRRP